MQSRRWPKIGYLFKTAGWQAVATFQLARLEKPQGLSEDGQLAFEFILGQFQAFNKLIVSEKPKNIRPTAHLLHQRRILAPIFSEFWATLSDHQPTRNANLLKIQKLLKWFCRKRSKTAKRTDLFTLDASLESRKSVKTQIQIREVSKQVVWKLATSQNQKQGQNRKISYYNQLSEKTKENIDKRTQRKLRLYGSVHVPCRTIDVADSELVKKGWWFKQKCNRVKLQNQKTIQSFKAGRSRSRPDFNDLWRQAVAPPR